MFRLNRHKQDKSGERIDFKFSSFQALQVPKGWDKLFVSIISVETGKTIAKSSKASVRDGTCQWTETLSESIWVSQVDTSKVIEDSFFKLVIAMGSARSGFLGEAAVNLTGYMSSRTSVPVLLPLKKCNHGTILQVKIQCLTPRTRPRDEQRKGLNSHVEDLTADCDDMDNKSDGSDNSFTRSIESSSSNHLSSTSHPGELVSRDTSFSASGSRHSSDSVEGSIGRAKFSPTNNLNGDGYNLIGRQDSNGSQNGAPYGTYLFDDRPRSNHLSYNSRISGTGSHLQNQRQEFGKSSSHVIATSSLRNAGSSKDHLEAAEDTIEELRAEARMWERNARKLMLDLEILRKEFSDQSRNQANLDMELLAVYKERDGLKQELEQLKILLEESVVKQRATENSKFQARGMAHIQKELEDEIKFQQESNANLDLQLKKIQESNIELVSILQELEETIEKQKLELDSFSAQKSKFSDMEDEIKFQQESNANLGLQLKKSQESNIELVAILQELEETIEKQKLEIDSFSALKSKFSDMENYSHGNEYNWDLNSTKEDTSEKTRKTSADWEGSDVENTLQNFHEQLGAENNRNLALQLLNLKESQNNLQATVQYLEKALEEKKKEIKIEQNLKNQALLDIEAEWRRKLFAKEEEVFSLEAKLSHSLKARSAEEMGFVNGGDPNLVREIEASKAKIQELERDCDELTEENLELIFKLKESKKELLTGSTSFNFSSNVPPANMSTCTSESEVGKLKAHIYQLEQELRKKEIISEGVATDSLQFKLIDLETKCTDLELQLESCKDKACNLDAKHLESQVEEDKTVKIVALKQQLKFYQEKEIDRDELACTGFENSESHTLVEMGEIFSELFKELQMALAHVKKPWYNICSHVNTECEYYLDNLANLNSTDVTNQKEQAEAILNYLVGLNKLLEARVLECEDVLKSSEVEIRERDTNIAEYQKKLEDYKLKENTLHLSIQELNSLKMKLEANLSLKEDEMEALRHFQGELEAQVSNLQKEKSHLEENMEIVLRESSINSKSLDGLRNDLIVLSSSVDFHVSANKTLERKSSELESGKGELELHLSELEEENIQLSERISGLEAQLRYLTDERESSRLELENSKSLAMNFRDEIRRLGLEMETQKVDLKQKLQDMQKRWSETQEECEFLKKANPKLEATAESLIEECSYLQKSNGELRKQKLELHERGMHLEAELKESQKSFSDCSKRVELLEAKLSSMREDIASKDKFLTSELDALLHENKEHKEKLLLVEGLLNQMYLEKVEVENLQREVAHLTEQLSATHGERERIASNAVFEVSNLRVDKAKLETALQEAQAKFKSSENKLYTLQTESGAKVQGLMGEIAASIQNQELLMADREKLMRLLEDVKSSEEKFEGTVNGLELKLTASEYERQQLVEETASLKVQLQKIAHLQDEVLALKSLLNVTEFEKEKLEASLQVLSEDSEELKAERISFVEKISSMQKAVSELEDCRRTRVSLEEKLLRMEGDLTAREALCSQDAELKNELSRVKRANSQLQRKIQNLEEEKVECLERAQALEDEVKLNKKEKHGRSQSSSNKFPGFSESTTDVVRIHEDLNLSEDDSNYHMQNGCPQVTGIEPVSKIQLLESELADALEANNMYKIQLNRLLSEGENRDADVPKKLTSEGEAVKKEGYEHKTSSLEAELRDIRERYFEMSLRYAELEAQREELVMKLKSVNSGKRWFS
ncbi:hypothetical protein HHK36_016691 [Tetracentron sinense]|uniref:C2 NT-type domain-containing protein n=1 Tax=Tetracentron sinense TaxID=13715 RepID=A0A834YXM0_TETSI|nr:hypothetical protein HHK36_016691 [Tetracentron sinense]